MYLPMYVIEPFEWVNLSNIFTDRKLRPYNVIMLIEFGSLIGSGKSKIKLRLARNQEKLLKELFTKHNKLWFWTMWQGEIHIFKDVEASQVEYELHPYPVPIISKWEKIKMQFGIVPNAIKRMDADPKRFSWFNLNSNQIMLSKL